MDAVAVEQPCRRVGTDSRNAWIAIRGVADESEEIGDQGGVDPELLADSFRREDLVSPAVDLHHPVLPDALRQVLVGGPDADLLHPFVGRGDAGGGGERVVGLELDHGPDGHAHGGERLFQRVELREERALDALRRSCSRARDGSGRTR